MLPLGKPKPSDSLLAMDSNSVVASAASAVLVGLLKANRLLVRVANFVAKVRAANRLERILTEYQVQVAKKKRGSAPTPPVTTARKSTSPSEESLGHGQGQPVVDNPSSPTLRATTPPTSPGVRLHRFEPESPDARDSAGADDVGDGSEHAGDEPSTRTRSEQSSSSTRTSPELADIRDSDASDDVADEHPTPPRTELSSSANSVPDSVAASVTTSPRNSQSSESRSWTFTPPNTGDSTPSSTGDSGFWLGRMVKGLLRRKRKAKAPQMRQRRRRSPRIAVLSTAAIAGYKSELLKCLHSSSTNDGGRAPTRTGFTRQCGLQVLSVAYLNLGEGSDSQRRRERDACNLAYSKANEIYYRHQVTLRMNDVVGMYVGIAFWYIVVMLAALKLGDFDRPSTAVMGFSLLATVVTSEIDHILKIRPMIGTVGVHGEDENTSNENTRTPDTHV